MITLSAWGGRSLRMALLTVAVATMAVLVLNARPASADTTVLYVDNGNPNCSDAGSGTLEQPFCTIKPAATRATAGQTVQVASGTYPELVTVSNSGAPGSPIVFTAAPGASVTVSGQANGFKVAGKSYVTIQGFAVANTSSYGFYVSSSSSNVILSGNTVTNTGSHGIYVTPSSTGVTVSGNQVSGSNGYGIWANTSSGVTIGGNTVSDTASYGIHVEDSSGVTVSGNDVSGAGEQALDLIRYGIKLAGTTSSLVSGNVSHDNSNDGIFLDANTSGARVTGNEAYGNARGYTRAAPGIDVRGYNNTVDPNVSHDNEDSGFQFYTGSHDNLVVDNLAYGNGDHGIDDLGSTGQRIISNTVYDNVAAGINVEGSSTGATIENNIAVDNGINSPRTNGNIRVDSTSTTGTTVNFNLVFLTVPDVMYQWGADKYNSLKEFKDATGQESKGIEADPSWVSL